MKKKRSVVSLITTLTVFLLLLTSTFTMMTLMLPVHAQTGTMLLEITLPRTPCSAAFDGVDTLYFTAYDPAYFDPTFAGRVWSIKTDGTGLTTVADLPGGTPPFPGEWPRNIVALAYDSSRDGLWMSISPVNEIHFLDLSTLDFNYRFDPPAAAAGAFNAPNGLAHDPVTDTLFFSAAWGLTIYLTDASGNPITEFDLETFFRGSNNGMAWDGEKLWLARHPGNILGSDFIHTYDVNLDLPAGTPRHGGPYFYDAGAPNGLAFDDVTFSPNCALWATPTDGTATLRAYEVPCPLFEAPDITPPTVTTSGPWPPGYLEVSFQDLESGLAEISLIGDPATRNAETTIPTFAEGTTSVVTVTIERINHDLESLVALRALDVRDNFRNIGTTIPAGMIGTLLGEASTPTGSPVTVEIDGVTVTFDEVTESGTTSVIVHDDGPPPPSGFMLGDPPTYFDISTTATYSGQVMVCIDYSGITFDDEAALRIGHYENGVWVDRTISLDMENNIICALVDSLSFFTALESEVPGVPPVADPNGPYTGTAGVPMQFTGAGSSDPDGTIVSYDWDFGDGGTGTGVFPTHTYASDGLYTVTLTVTDDDGLTDTAATTAEIGEAPVEPEPPVAIFTEDLHIAIVGQPITLDPSSSYDPDGSIVLYEWDFDGDGIYDLSTITPDMVSNAWGAPGTYTVTLMVTDNDGLTDTATDTKTITPPPTGPTIESCDSGGVKKDTFLPGEDVYVTGSGYSTSTTFDLYVVEDVATWTDGMAIPSRVSGTATSISSDASGDVLATLVWSAPLTVGKYDIVVDVNGNGVYDEDIDALDDRDIEVTAGFNVVPEVAFGTAIALLGMIFALVGFLGFKRFRPKFPL